MKQITDFAALSHWIIEHAERFMEEHYTADEIAILAIACGFSRESVAQWESEQPIKGRY
jgi:hypothetical protein